MPKFRWRTHQENVAILGMQGTGKTSLARKILRTVPQVPRVIWSPQLPMEHYGAFGRPTSNVADIVRNPGAAWVWVGEFGPREFDAICTALMEHAHNVIFVIDDIHERVTKHKVPAPFARLINSGRNRGICCIFITPSPNIVHNNVLQSSHHVFAFAFPLETQIEWLSKNYFGRDAYVLIPRQLRRKEPTLGADYDVLPPHSYLYKHHASSEAQLHVEGGGGGDADAQGEAV